MSSIEKLVTKAVLYLCRNIYIQEYIAISTLLKNSGRYDVYVYANEI